ncbi:MAG: hypothetical protein ACI87E_001235 [Mariniblastus sp.]|jgi:hypothetical protein
MKKARAQVNWSAVACEAFEKTLSELGPIKEITSVEGAVQRMKSLPLGEDGGGSELAHKNGVETGKHWALNFASPGQLRRMEALKNRCSQSEWEALMVSREGWIELGRCIEPAGGGRPGGDGPKRRGLGHDDDLEGDIEGREGHDGPPRNSRRRPRRFRQGPPASPKSNTEIWRSILDRRPGHPAFFLGFATAALEIWDQLKDQF